MCYCIQRGVFWMNEMSEKISSYLVMKIVCCCLLDTILSPLITVLHVSSANMCCTQCACYTLIPLCTLMEGYVFSYTILQFFFFYYDTIMKGLPFSSLAVDEPLFTFIRLSGYQNVQIFDLIIKEYCVNN